MHVAVEEVEELNMIPVMNLFIVLIPFLLAAAAFYHVGVVPASVPQHTPDSSDVPKTPVTIALNVTIDLTEIKVTASSTNLEEEEVAGRIIEAGQVYVTTIRLQH